MPDVPSQLVERQIHRWDRIDTILKKGPPQGPEPRSRRPPVITISRETGSGGRVVAQELSHRLGMDLFGISIIDAIADSADLDRRVVSSLDENSRSDVENYIVGLLSGSMIDNREFATRLARTIATIETHGLAVILGRGASFILGERSDLRLRFHAPVEWRVRNMMEYEELDEAEARRKVADADERRRDYARKFFDADISDSANYDLVIDTSRIRPADCVTLAIDCLKLRLPPAERAALHIAGG